MHSYSFCLMTFLLCGLVISIVTETPQQIVNRYNKYLAICNGFGYKEKSCQTKGKVAFLATCNADINQLGLHKPVIFKGVKLNDGGGYNFKTGKFTAPEDGIYSFSWSILASSNHNSRTEIVKNNSYVARNYADGRMIKSGYYLTSSSTVNIKMKANEQVWIRTEQKVDYIGGGSWSFFSGFKI